MTMSRLSTSLDVIAKKPLYLLDLPVEVRYMIYDILLPKRVQLTQRYHFHLPLLQVSRKIYQEALQVFKRRNDLSLRLQDRESHLLAIWWINQLGNDLASQIRTLEIETWVERNRSINAALFRRSRFLLSFGVGPPPGFSIKYTLLDVNAAVKFHYSSPCLNSRPPFPQYLQETILGILGDRERISIGTEALKSVIDVFVKYSKYGYGCHPTARHIVRVERPTHQFWRDPHLQSWTYLFPASVKFSSMEKLYLGH